jgi:peptidoglycan hydrolase CwlO-like protein
MKNLKSKWNLLNHDYQTLIHRKDFRGTLKKRKEELEEELNKVEGYIKRLDKQTIFINTKDNEEKLPTKNLRAYKSSIKL